MGPPAIPTVERFMSKWFVTLTPDMEIYEAIDTLLKKRMSGVPVVDRSGELVGILTEKDCLRVMSTSVYGQMAQGTVADFMSTVKVTVDIDMNVFTVAEKFLSTNFTILPVLQNGKLVGRISRQDMLRAIKELESTLAVAKLREDEEYRKITQPANLEELQKLASQHKPENLAALLSGRHIDEPPRATL